jgi:hypothetical protein
MNDMAARAIWKGSLDLGRTELPVKLYSAVEDRTVHFHRGFFNAAYAVLLKALRMGTATALTLELTSEAVCRPVLAK